ncbi:MAG: hypothetical protein DRP60_07585 [Spirochaetes bacterium]|nr:MAG: hypothetical protein DRP60_07585 [Spirochaetota bacterium]
MAKEKKNATPQDVRDRIQREVEQLGNFYILLHIRKIRAYYSWRAKEWLDLRAEAEEANLLYYVENRPPFEKGLKLSELKQKSDLAFVKAQKNLVALIEQRKWERLEAEERLRLENQHYEFLKNLDDETSEKAALDFLRIAVTRDMAKEAIENDARKSTLAVFHKYGGNNLSTEFIENGQADKYAYTALKKPNRYFEKLVAAEKSSWPENIDEILPMYLFVFEDIVMLDDRAIQRVLREIDTSTLAKAMKGTDQEIQEMIFRNMSKRAAALQKEDMDFMGPTRRIDVQAAKDLIVDVILKLEAQGHIVISDGSDDVLV